MQRAHNGGPVTKGRWSTGEKSQPSSLDAFSAGHPESGKNTHACDCRNIHSIADRQADNRGQARATVLGAVILTGTEEDTPSNRKDKGRCKA